MSFFLSHSWWTAEFAQIALIEKIQVYIPKAFYDDGDYEKFKVETKLNKNDNWKVCKGVYSLKAPISPHEIQCEMPTKAKYMKLSLMNNRALSLLEVSVYGKHPLFKQYRCSCENISSYCLLSRAYLTEITDQVKMQDRLGLRTCDIFGRLL